MVYTNALQAPNRQQWETSSQYSQSWNCGPTCVAFIVGFYKDYTPAIEYSRRLLSGMGPYFGVGPTPETPIYGCPPRTPTNSRQQQDMLIKRGVPATSRQIDSVAQLHGLVDTGRRPTIIGIEMSRVPQSVRGHSFLGWHAVVVISGASVNGRRGFWIMDPNFAAGSSASRRFYSDDVMQSAWASNSPRWSVVPDDAKPTADPPTSYVRFNRGVNGVNLREGPNSNVDNILATAYSDADPKPNGIIKRSGDRASRTSGRKKLHATVKGRDGQYYFRISVRGMKRTPYVQTRFMHRVHS